MYSRNNLFLFKSLFWIFLLISSTGCKKELPEYVAIQYFILPDQIDYNIHVKPILSDKCYLCHGPDEGTRKAGMRFDTENGLFEKTLKGNFPVKPGNLNRSEMINRILSDDLNYIMPPTNSHLTLNPREKAIIVKWVEQGAVWKKHWAFIPPEKSTIPNISNNWPIANEIDSFIYEKLLQNNLEPNPTAKREQLLRRVTIDLTGLPPTLSEITGFLNDSDTDAYEKVVDRLLKSKSHAERLTLEWMDVARYSDSHGYQADGSRMMWPWRDWVINSFFENKPYDKFVTEQIAGDLLPRATKEQVLATGFNRNHAMSAEGGIIEEEFRLEYVTNRTNTFGTAFLGLTMECAKCHDHKFDPISQKDYFKLFAYFNNIRELGLTTQDGNFGPLMLLSTDEEDKKISELSLKIDSLAFNLELKKKEFISNANFKASQEFILTQPIVHHSFEKISKTKEKSYLDSRIASKLSGDVELVSGLYGLASKFDNEYDRIDLKELPAFELYDPFSISIWVSPEKRPLQGKTMTIIGNSSHKNELYKGWDLAIDSEGFISTRLVSVGPNNYIHKITKENIPVQEWTHLLMTYDGSAKASGFHLYINGKEESQYTEYDRLYKSIVPKKKGDLIIGKSPRTFTGDNGIFIGLVDELSIYDKEVFPLQVPWVYKQSKEGKKPIIWCPKDPYYLDERVKLKKLYANRLELITPIVEMMVMEEMKPQRKTFVLERGEYDKPKEEVGRGTPNEIFTVSPENDKSRLGLSRWLFDKNNPLTSRVAVNRYWQMIFGRGLVSTANDFGNQGSPPSHTKLLDWLAVDFQESGWNVRLLIKKMVMSHTYKQDSKLNEKLWQTDPENILLARAPSYRLQAEFIRNNVLKSSGLIKNTVGGKSVKPYQPEGLWAEKGVMSKDLSQYEQDHDDDQYRKSMYTFNKRTAPPPYMLIFDMPNRYNCIVTRDRTNTPLQALSLLNDPQFVEASKALAVRMKTEGGDTLQNQITLGFQLAISRKPNARELQILTDLYIKELSKFKVDIDNAIAYLNVGDYRVPKTFDPSDLAALTIVANTLFNMDEVHTKR